MEIQIGIAKINKYASSESGDTLEVVERPNGGLSVVMADGQRSGKSAKRISNIVVRKVIQLLAEGVRDGPAARAASDYLYSLKSGKVQSTLNIISVDLESNTLVITQNNPAPIYVGVDNEINPLTEPSIPVGIYRNTRPVIHEMPINVGLTLVAFTDGLSIAGERKKLKLDLPNDLMSILHNNTSAQDIADYLINQVLDLDDNRPLDDTSIVVLRVLENHGIPIRRMTVRLPIQ